MKYLKPAFIPNLIATLLCLALTARLIGFFCFQYRFSFNYELDINDHYYLVFVFPLVLAVVVLRLWADRFSLSVPQVLYLIILCIFSILMLFSRYYNWGSEHFSVVIATIAATGLILFLNAQSIISIICFVLSLLLVYELYWGWLQYWEAIDFASNISLDITGSFQNSGVFAMYLVVQLPILFFVVIQYRSQNFVTNKKWMLVRVLVFIFVLSQALFLVYKTQSRSAYVGFGVLIVGWLLMGSDTAMKMRFKGVSKKWLFAIGALFLVLLTFTGYYLFAMKKASAFGRLMKLHITGQHFEDQLLTGTGLGRFSWYYPQWQAAYFSTQKNPPEPFFLNVGESYIIFNEPVQLFKELGLIGFLLLIMVLVYFFTIRSVKHRKLLVALKLTVIALLACSFTSYPLHVNYMLWLFLCSIFSAFSLGTSPVFPFVLKPFNLLHRKWFFGLITGIILAVLGMASLDGMEVYKAFCQWKELQDGVANRSNAYLPIKSKLAQNGKFLTDYAYVLLEEGKANEAVQVMKEAETYFLSRQTKELLVSVYTVNNDLVGAIREQVWLCNYLPNKFRLKYELLKMHLTNKDTLKAKQIAHTILTMPVKKPSEEVNRFKAGAQQVIGSTN